MERTVRMVKMGRAGRPADRSGTSERVALGIHLLAAVLVLLPVASAQIPGDIVTVDGVWSVGSETSCEENIELSFPESALRIQGGIQVIDSRTCRERARSQGDLDARDLVISAKAIHLGPDAFLRAADGLDASPVHKYVQEAGKRVRVAAGPGGQGGNVTLQARRLTLVGTIHIGNGGRGGDAIVRSTATSGIVARGGDGGQSGSLHLDGLYVAGHPSLAGGFGGRGGDAEAIYQNQSGNESRDRRDRGENGTDIESPAGGDARARAINGTTGERDGFDGGDATAYGGNGARGAVRGGHGGNATAIAGEGGPGRDLPLLDKPAGTGGSGGKARAFAGNGGQGPVGGGGGWARAFGGDGGPGGDNRGNDTENGVRAGHGGSGGWGSARGGRGGCGDRHGGAGGAATAIGGDGGNGGDAPGRGGRAGSGGPAGRAKAIGGEGGCGESGSGGEGGEATAYSGQGGDGGNGTWSWGEGGDFAASEAVGGDGGDGVDGGPGGSATSVQGDEGADGHLLPGGNQTETTPAPETVWVVATILTALMSRQVRREDPKL